MKAMLFGIVVGGSMLTACSDVPEGVNDNINDGNDNVIEMGTLNVESGTYNLEKLNGSYMFISDEERIRVVLDNGVLRYTDGRGNVSYRLSESGDRIVISGESPSIYLIKSSNNDIQLINIDKSGILTGDDIKLEIIE